MRRLPRRVGRVLLALLAVLLMAAAGLALVAYLPAGDDRPHPFNQDRNAVWLEHRWLERAHTEEEIAALVRELRGRGVRYAYPHVIPFDRGGRLPPHDREQMRRFLAVARREAPELQVLPWVGGLRVGWRRQKHGSIELGDLGQRQRIVAECRGLIDEGFHGIHLNVEPVGDGNVEFLSLLRSLRTAIGEQATLSISAIRPGPIALPVAPNFLWTPGYYARVGAVADQVVVMAYDTAIPTPAAYTRYVGWGSRRASVALRGSSRHARLLMGVPTYDETGLMHRGDVETPAGSLRGIVQGLRGGAGDGTFEGVALYAHWTTDEKEWATYDRLWRGR